eukprot:TRINITY_DN16240_c2_g1_i1.p1 TRINITY_DN16240_c2_g1~~TRINITY_DN16240_c2_g1_i1.p1  ORF type:complete len:197 (+),score=-17.07 TRINITY_DN16240_c2_g1_i1:84-593(+)
MPASIYQIDMPKVTSQHVQHVLQAQGMMYNQPSQNQLPCTLTKHMQLLQTLKFTIWTQKLSSWLTYYYDNKLQRLLAQCFFRQLNYSRLVLQLRTRIKFNLFYLEILNVIFTGMIRLLSIIQQSKQIVSVKFYLHNINLIQFFVNKLLDFIQIIFQKDFVVKFIYFIKK